MTRPTFDQLIAGWRGPVLAALAAVLAGLPGLLLLPPLDRDESRYAQATSQMLETGNFVDIRFQDEPRWKKPVGIYWLQAAAVAITGGPEGRDVQPYRLPSLLGAALAAWACAWAGAAMLGARAGFWAGAILGATYLLSTEAGIAKTDAVLAGAITLMMAALGRIYLAERGGERPRRLFKVMFWLGLGLSILIKGPIGPLVAGSTLIALSAWDRNLRWLKRLGWGWGVPLMLLVVGPWAIAITVATDGGFWREALGGDIGGKVTGAAEHHWGLPGYYLAIAPVLLFPATLLLPAAAWTAWRGRAEPVIRFLICWVVPAWLIFELSPTKLGHYTLPTFGGIALLMAAALTRGVDRWPRRLGAVLMAATACVLMMLIAYGLTRFGGSTAQTWAAIAIAMTASAAAVGAYLLINRAPVAALTAALLFGVIAHAAMAGTLRQLRPLSIAPRLETVLAASQLLPRQGAGAVALTTFHEPSAVFLIGRNTELTDGAGAARALAQGRPAVVEARDAETFMTEAAALGVVGRAVGEVSGHNYSNGDNIRLTVYAPPQNAGVRP